MSASPQDQQQQHDEDVDDSTLMTPEEEEVWLGKYFSGKTVADDDNNEQQEEGDGDDVTIDQQMENLEKSFGETTMQLAAKHAGTNLADQEDTVEACTNSLGCAMRNVYAELHTQTDPEVVGKLRLAMEGIPEGTRGLKDCQTYFSSKQLYTLQDVLVAQYILNDGLLMRQNHGTGDEYHVDIAEPLV